MFPLMEIVSDALVMTTKPVKRPIYQRLLSVPVETQSNFKLQIIPRSFSDPGCLNGLNKTQQKRSIFKSGSENLLISAGTKKHTKKGYSKLLFLSFIKETSCSY